MHTVRLGNGSAYWGDMLEPALELAEKGDIKYLGFDHLSELTLAIFQRTKKEDPSRGYIPDLLPWLEATLPIARRNGITVITNGGCANPAAGAAEVVKLARRLGLRGLKVATVLGDDIVDRLDDLRGQGVLFPNLDTGEEDIGRIRERIVAANAYIGADGIIEALQGGADVIVTGRVSDTALFVGPMMHEFGWRYSEPYWDKIGAAITIGHIIECAALSSGAVSNFWREAKDMWRVGYPLAEVDENGDALITKVPGSGGLITPWTIKEQLIYEVHNPARYLMPDGVADFTTLHLEEAGRDAVRVSNMSGRPRPETLKVCIGFQDGWIAEGLVLFSWPDALDKAHRAEEIVRCRLEQLDAQLDELRFDYVGVNTLHGSMAPPVHDSELNEVGLRIAGHGASREAVDVIRREVTHLWTIGGLGTAPAAPSRPRPMVTLWPTLVPRDQVPQSVSIEET